MNPLSLNEGRSVSSGDTRRLADLDAIGGRRSTKAGALAPATLLNSAKRRHRDETSLFGGRVSLDDDAFEAISRDCEQYFVSMISTEQLKLP